MSIPWGRIGRATPLLRDLPAEEIGRGLSCCWRELPREGRFLLSTVALQHLGRGRTLPFGLFLVAWLMLRLARLISPEVNGIAVPQSQSASAHSAP